MKPTEAAALLTIAAAYDNRKPDADQAKAWAMALDGLRFEDCREVVVAHYRRSRDWLMPVDVINGVTKLRADRRAQYGPIPAPSHLDPDSPTFDQDYARYMVETNEAMGDGTYQPPAPLELERRDMRQLGAGRSVREGLRGDPIAARVEIREARRKLQEAEAERQAAKDAERKAREEKRAADRAARETSDEEPAA